MKVVNFKGGIGNQMFQYAFYKKLSQNDQVFADLSWYKNKSIRHSREYKLDKAFSINVNISNRKFCKFGNNILVRVINKFLLEFTRYKIVKNV